jgi:copper oxidase (laccase) domain-containing protein
MEVGASSSAGREESGVTHTGRRGFVRQIGKSSLRALREATNSGMRADIWAWVVAGR